MRITAVEMMKIDAFTNDMMNNSAVEAIYVFPYTSVRGTDVISIVAIINDGLLDQTDDLKEALKGYKTNVGYKKILTFSLDSRDNYDIDKPNNSLKSLASGRVIFDRNNYYRMLKDKLDYEFLNTTNLERKSPIR